MIELPLLNDDQKKALNELQEFDGWKVVEETMDVSIRTADVELANWKFEYDDDGKIKQKGVLEFEKKQMEVRILKEFWYFLGNGVIIEKEVKTQDSYKNMRTNK